jgi:hypothetical protein
VTVTVAPVNDAPVAVNDTASTNEDTPVTVTVLTNDSDPEGDPLTVTAASAANGTVVINADGTITYTPTANFNGTDTITYTISDGHGGTSTATVTVSVAAVNDAPVAVNDTTSTNEDTSVTVAVLTNDTDVDGDPLTVTVASAANGTVAINADGTITYTPAANFNGTDTISYTISDGHGGTSTATVTVSVAAVTEAPVAVNDTASTNEDTPVTVAVLTNDSDPDGDPLTVTTASAANGTVVINADGTITYTPAANFNGTDTITYTISDGQGGTATATVTVTVALVNDAPVDTGESIDTVVGQPVTVDVLGNASDPDGDPLSVTGAAVSDGTVTINPDGTVTYTPDPGFAGTATLTYIVSDGRGGTATSTVTITVRAESAANIDQLLEFGQMRFPDGQAPEAYRDFNPTFIAADPIVLNTVNGIDSLNGTTSLDVDRPIIAAVNGIAPLNGIGTFDIDGSPVSEEVARLNRVTDLRFGLDRLFDRRFGDFTVEPLTGFSVRATDGDQVMLESVVRDRTIYLEIRDIGGADSDRFVEHQVRMADGRALPGWIHFDSRGLAIIERPVDVEVIRLIVRSIREDGSHVDTPVIIQGATGEIQIDHGADRPQGQASGLDAAAMATASRADMEAARIAAAFH